MLEFSKASFCSGLFCRRGPSSTSCQWQTGCGWPSQCPFDLISESSRDCPASRQLFCVTPWGAPGVLFPPHPNLLWPLACLQDLSVNHCWAVTQLWPPCGVGMFVPGWVLSPESGCCMASPTCGHTASCGSSVLLFLCLKMAAAAWHSRQQVAGGWGPFRPRGAGCQGERPKPEFQAALLCGHSHRWANPLPVL